MVRTVEKFAIIESNYGRDGGWLAEVNSQIVAELSDAKYDDMFWDSYRLDGVQPGGQNVQTDEFWNRAIVFRSRTFPEIVVTNCIARWRQHEQRLVVRGLSIQGITLNIVEKVLYPIWRLLWGRRRQ